MTTPMTTEWKIRSTAEADVPAIASLIRALADYERAAPGSVSLTDDLLREALFGRRASVEALVVEAGPEMVGYALYFHNFSSWRGRRGLFLEDIFVRPEWRGRGIGKALVAELTRIARERGCARMEWIVLDWNHSAITFYESLGATPLKGWTIYRMALPEA